MQRPKIGQLLLRRNTPSLLNVGYYKSYFWDGRAATLYDQVEEPLFALHEMHSSPERIHRTLSHHPTLGKLYALTRKQQVVTSEKDFTKKALAAHLWSIRSTDSYANHAIYTPSEQQGKKLFYGKAGCSSCHAGKALTDQQYHYTGLKKQAIVRQSNIVQGQETETFGHDHGRGDVVSGKQMLFAFRTPSLHNVSLTAPYMHDGSLKTLQEVIEFYDRGGDEKGHLPRLHLSQKEKQDLQAFLLLLLDPRYMTLPQKDLTHD
ncbi:hypothetical protein GCM10008938_49660 [Deinococcus roseus]|uniref:Cytochrome c domain-containing protein n=1 Tax=Deinococcus roseus TaxID=392414 RepID=A0ABQ2DHB2_9DEIO|nr:hypothetical protein GCM10008938_49660 [Deinococcus roseus]